MTPDILQIYANIDIPGKWCWAVFCELCDFVAIALLKRNLG